MNRYRWMPAVLLLSLAPTAPALAEEPILGTWTVISSQVAPWYDGGGAKPDVDPALAHATIVFAKDSVKGPRAVNCNKVKYTVSTVGPEDLFEGGLKNPAKDAAALGFKTDKITSINEGCLRTDADMEMDFAMIDKENAVFGLNNVVYKMKRKTP